MKKLAPVLLASACILVFTGCRHKPGYYLEKATDLSKRGECAEAALNYRKALQENSTSGPAYLGLGICQYQMGQISDSVSTLSRAVELMPEDTQAEVELANATLSQYMITGRPQGLYDRISKLTADLLRRNPQSPDGLRLQGSLLLGDQKVSEAIEAFEKANSLKPSDPAIVLSLAEALKRDNRAAEGERLALNLVHEKPEYSPLYDWLYEQYTATNRPAEAESILKTRVAKNPAEPNGILQLAMLYHRRQRPAEMKNTLDLLLKQPKVFPNRLLLAGDFYRSTENWDEAARYYKEASAGDKNAKGLYANRLARVYAAQGKRSEALKTLGEAIGQAPADVDARALRAFLLVESNRPEDVAQAISDCTTSLKTRPQDASLHFLLGRAYLLKGEPESAKAQFVEAAGKNPGYLEPRLTLAQLGREKADYRTALRYSEEALRLDPRNPRARLLHAAALAGSGDLLGGRRELTALLQQYPDSSDAQLEMGLLYLAEKKSQPAADIFQKVYRANPSSTRALAGLTASLLDQGKAPQAIQMLTAEVDKHPENMEIHRYLASVAASAGRREIALAQYKILAEKFPNSLEYRLRLGESYQAQGDTAKAIEVYEAAQQLSPNDAILIGRIGVLRDATGKTEEAGVAYQRSLALSPNDPVLMNNRAYNLAESGGNLDEAVSLMEAALKKMPDNPALLDTLGWVYLKKGMTDSSIQVLSRIVRDNPDTPAFRYHLGAALLQKGDKAGAKRELEAGLAKNPTKEDQAKIKALMGRIG